MATQTDTLDPTKGELAPALPFRARSVTINNSTGQWWELFNIPIAAYAQNVTIRIVPSTTPRIIARTPPGFKSTPQPGELGHVTYSDQDLPLSSGVIVAPASGVTAPSIFGVVTASGLSSGGTITPPAGANVSTDMIVLVVNAGNGGNNLVPSIATPAGFTPISVNSPQVAVNGVNQDSLNVFTAPYTSTAITLAGTNTGAGGINAHAVVVRNVTTVTGSAGTFTGNAAALTVQQPSVIGTINLYCFGTFAAVNFSAENPTNALRISDTGGTASAAFVFQLPSGALAITFSGAATAGPCAISLGLA